MQKRPRDLSRGLQAVEKVQWAFCRHSIQYEGAPAPSYSPCKKELLSFKQRIFDKLKAPGPMVRGPCDLFYSLLNASMGFSRAAFLAGR